MKTAKTLLFAAIAALFLSSCGEEEVKPHDIEYTKDSVDFDKQIAIDLISVNFPSPSAMGKKFSGAGLSYNKSLLNSTGKSYSTKAEQSLGLGVYGADLGFACSFNQSQDALAYLGSIGKLSEQVGVASAFDMEFNKQLIASLGKADSQDIMIDKAYKKAERHMRSNERMANAAMMVMGGWVEGLYITTEMVFAKKDDPKTKGLYMEVWNYVSAYQHVRKLLDEYKGNADFKNFEDAFKEAETVLRNVAYNTNFGPKDIDPLRTAVQTLRTKLVK